MQPWQSLARGPRMFPSSGEETILAEANSALDLETAGQQMGSNRPSEDRNRRGRTVRNRGSACVIARGSRAPRTVSKGSGAPSAGRQWPAGGRGRTAALPADGAHRRWPGRLPRVAAQAVASVAQCGSRCVRAATNPPPAPPTQTMDRIAVVVAVPGELHARPPVALAGWQSSHRQVCQSRLRIGLRVVRGPRAAGEELGRTQ
jgi:hypothetical protein